MMKKSILDVFVGDSVCFANCWWAVIAAERQSGSGEVKLTLECNKLRIIQLFHRSVFLLCKKGKGERGNKTRAIEEKAFAWLIKAKQVTENRATLRQQKRRNKRKIGGENVLDS